MKRCVIPVVVLLVLLGALTACTEEKKPEPDGAEDFAQKENCSVHFIDSGKADAILVMADGEAMLIDAGYRENADRVVAYLKAQGVSQLKYLVLSHGDKDHVGGMAAVLKNFAVERLLISPKKENSGEYNAMLKAANASSVSVGVPQIGDSFQLGKGSFTVLAPGQKALAEGSDNDASLVLQYGYGNRSFLFMGDALSTTEKEIRDNKLVKVCDVLKVGHHGKNDATKKKFVKAVAPVYAVITCGEAVGDDEDGTPDSDVLEVLEELKVRVLRTDEKGTLVFDTDGTDLTVRK